MSTRAPLILILCLAPAALLGVRGDSAPPAPDGAKVMKARCASCHDAVRKAGGVVLAGPNPLAVRGVPKRVLDVLASGRMPPSGPLPARESEALRLWADNALRAAESEPPWSFRPVRETAPPAGKWDSLSAHPVDRFVFQKLAARGLRPGPPASRTELLRRVTVDLTGLPPTPEERDAFLADRAPGAYERLVDRLLASPAYGERWARHWLDVVRFGESHGYEQNHLRPNAWPYRDYVIRALNEDRPYDQFVRDQLASDAEGSAPAVQAATGFLVAGVHDTVGNQTEEGSRQQRANDLEDIVSTTAEAFLGLTVGCARCHDHKFDPIPQMDYYRLAAVFSGVRHGERRLGDEPPARRDEVFPTVPARFVRFTVLSTEDGAEPCLDEMEVYGPEADGPNLAAASAGGRASASSLLPGYPIHRVEHLNDGRLGNEWSWISAERGRGSATIMLPEKRQVRRVRWSRDGTPDRKFRDRTPASYRIEVSTCGRVWTRVVERTAGAPSGAPAGMQAYAGRFGPAEPVYFLRRGDVMQRGDRVAPGALSRIPGLPAELGAPASAGEPEVRLALARWICDPRNPLTARVAVNRVWQGHFGRGLAPTPSDFGRGGRPPSHPELLDWLAARFASPAAQGGMGWSRKKLHRLLVTSYTYRQSASAQGPGARVDAENRLLWRMPLRRMEAEAVRDAVLQASGKLDRRMGGPGYRLFKYRVVNVAIYEPLELPGPDTWRRGIYRESARAIRDDLLGALDCPESSQRAPRRESTTTALQALSLLNGPFMQQQAGFFAERVEKTGTSVPDQVRRAFLLAFCRPPTPDESKAASALVRAHGLPPLCRSLLNASEFLYY